MAGKLGLDITKRGLEFCIDPSNTKSFISGDVMVKDIVGKQDIDLYNGVLFDTNNLGSLYFDGASNYGYTSNSYDIFKSELTYDVWVNRTSVANVYNIIYNTYLPYLGFQNTNKFIFSWYTTLAGVNTQRIIYSNNTYSDNTWYNITCTLFQDVSTGNCYCNMYINGILENSVTLNSVLDAVHNATGSLRKMMIGAWNSTTPTYFFNGKISTFKIYNKVLTSDEVLSNYNSSKNRFF